MLGCVRARSLPHVRLRRLPSPAVVRPLHGSWSIRFSSTNSSNSSGGGGGGGGGKATTAVDSSSATAPAPAAVDDGPVSSPPPGFGDHQAGFDPASMIPPPPPPPPAAAAEATGDAAAAGEPWSTASASASQFWADFPDSVTPLMGDAGMYVLHGVVNTVLHITGGSQAGVQWVHHLTGLPWWATIGVATIFVRISLLPVVVYQAGHMDRMRTAWPEIQTLRGHLADRLDEIPQRQVLRRWRKYRKFFSGTRGILGLHGTHVPGLLATPLVNMPVFVMFVWSIRSMLRDNTIPGLDTGGMLWFVDLTVTDSSLMLPIISTALSYTSLELVKMKGATGWIKIFQDGVQTFILLMLPWVSTFPQGVFMYWIPSSLFQIGQGMALKNASVRTFLGLKPLREPPRGAVRAPPPVPGDSSSQEEQEQEQQKSLTAGVLTGRKSQPEEKPEHSDGIKS